MYTRLREYVDAECWGEAGRELMRMLKSGSWDDELAVLAAATANAAGDAELAYDYIQQGLSYNSQNYELYYMLGDYYRPKNINQAWLCYENAEYYCADESDLEIIRHNKEQAKKDPGWHVNKVAIVVLTHNTKDLNIMCLESIRNTNMQSSYELIVVDNASDDGTVEWLKEQEDIRLICNKENKGFPAGCNQGIEAAGKDCDILLLNSDTIVVSNAIFWLRMGLYEKENIGATGSVTNYTGNGQAIDEVLDVEGYLRRGREMNVPQRNPYEKKIFLTGFSLLLRREALNQVGLLDTRFYPGQFEDVDLGVRLNYSGWQVVLCWNSFVFHFGHGGGSSSDFWDKTAVNVKKELKNKWGFNVNYYTFPRKEIVDLIQRENDAAITVLDVGCGCGMTLSHIKYRWPNSKVKGIEIVEPVAKLGANIADIICGNIETADLPYEKMSFDYIILADVLEHLRNPDEVIKKLLPYLKDGGRVLGSVPNIMNQDVLLKLLQGDFEYGDAGILDRTHLRFFTLNSMRKMLDECGLEVERLCAVTTKEPESEKEREMLEALYRIPYIAERKQFQVYQYFFCAGKKTGIS